MQIIDTTGSWY